MALERRQSPATHAFQIAQKSLQNKHERPRVFIAG